MKSRKIKKTVNKTKEIDQDNETEGKSTEGILKTINQTAGMIGGLLFQQKNVIIFGLAAVGIYYYGDYAAV